ncbi:MAG: carboxypeptidase-like regulatory domain-containing protein, partial [Rikenellaceae bacterium]
RGQVIDAATKKGVVGATVLIEGTTKGAISDDNGKFNFTAKEGEVINVSFIGMENKSYKIKANDANLTLELIPSAIAVDDVVVTGYQVMSRGRSASAITPIKAKDITKIGLSSIDQMLQGKIAGMMVMNTSGEPSATPKIRVRGNSTLSGNKAPVWVLDGVILEQSVVFDVSNINSDDAAYLIGNAIAGINPNDIETITVLKDASATAIYGVKAANGVIVVTTKKGAIGRPIISYNGGITFNTRPSYGNFDRMTATERMQLSKDIIEGGLEYARTPWGEFSYEGLYDKLSRKEINAQQFDEKVRDMQNRNTDWFKELFRNSVTHTHNMNLSGGTEKAKYYFSAGYDNNQGAAIKSNMTRFTALGKVGVTLNKYVDFTAQINYNKTDNIGYHSTINPFNYAYKTTRTAPLYDENGDYAYYNLSQGSKALSYNILNEMNTTGQSSCVEGFGSQLALNVKLLNGLKYNGTFSYNTSNTSKRDWATDHSKYISDLRGYDFDVYAEDSDDYKQSTLPYGGILG